jgi:cell division protein FtsL
MLGKMKCAISRAPMNTIPLVVFVLLLTAAINIYITKLDTDQLNDHKDSVVQQEREQEWSEIELVINSSQIAARQNSKYLAQKIEVDLLRQYKDLDVLKQEFQHQQFDSKFYDVLEANLSQEDGAPSSIFPVPYRTFVGLEEGVIAFFSHKELTVPNPDNSKLVPWESYISNSPNPELAQEAVNSVISRESNLVFSQTIESPNNGLEKNDSMTMATLKKAYLKYGVDGLSYYNLLSPSYITETGDIFNTDDKTFMSSNENYKLIILQSINMGDILDKYKDVFFVHEKQSTENITFLSDFVSFKHINTVGWSFILFILSVWLINIFNFEKKRVERESQYDLEGDNVDKTE